jgi:Uncharacterized homolog of the cytoplasmic domain of flagellar protein FhlB
MPDEKGKKLQAAALRYDPEQDDIPVLAAFGEGFVAQRIIETAKTHGVPVTVDKQLASVLSKLSVGDQIPPELYTVVAKLLVFVGEMDRGYGDRLNQAGKNKNK